MNDMIINLQVLYHQNGRMIAAVSNDMPGLIVHASSLDELDRRIPLAIREMLEAKGMVVHAVTVSAKDVAGFKTPAFVANAALCKAEPVYA